MTPRQSGIESHGVVESEPSAVYGSGPTVLRIGNGGAGATGLLEVLSTAYLERRSDPSASISWVCNHSRNTQLALLHGYVDVALTYEREPERLAATEGWSISHGCVFHDHFILAGPTSNPACLASKSHLLEAFKRIARVKAPFHSRADGSATMAKERWIWDRCNVRPYQDQDIRESWYTMTTHSPAEAIRAADAAGAYLLIDRSTLLRQVADGYVHNTTVFCEPKGPNDLLMNSCYALHAPDPPEEVRRFLEFVTSAVGQDIIRAFGAADVGISLFAAIDDGFAKQGLEWGHPQGRRWESRKTHCLGPAHL